MNNEDLETVIDQVETIYGLMLDGKEEMAKTQLVILLRVLRSRVNADKN